jgi:tRNA 2-thiouridine synthesizing protein A
MPVTTHVDRFVDAKGQMCPMPILTLAKAIKELQPGQIIAIAATDPGSKKDIPAWAQKTGHTILETTEEGGVITFYVQKAA